MSFKNLLLFLVVAGAVVWFVAKDEDLAPQKSPESLTAGQQRQMQKAKSLGADMQKQLDQRMRSSP